MTIWRKCFRDLVEESARTTLVVLAIAIGVAGFASVLASYAILTRELNRGYMATNPASATLRADSVDDALVSEIASVKGVRDVEARRVLNGRIKGDRGGWKNLTLFVIRDFSNIRVSKLSRERGAWPPAAGEILIERDALGVANLKVGDRATVRKLSGVTRTLKVAGVVHDVGQAQARMENAVYGYVTVATLAQLGEEPEFNQVKIVVDGDSLNEKHVREVAERVKQLMESRGRVVMRVDVPTPGKHPHADIMGMLMLVLASFGFFVLLLAGVIVVNLLTALMAAQVRQIGVMKAIGGTRLQIARIYFAQALLLGGAATLIAIPAAIAGSRALCRAMAVFLNFDISSFAIPAWVFALVAIAGLLVPLLAAAWPAWKGSGVSVRRALSDFGVSRSQFGESALDRFVARFGGITRPLLLSIRNSFRRRTRLALTVVTLVAGGLFFMTALNLRASMIRTLDRLFSGRKYDLTLSIAGMVDVQTIDRVMRATPGVRRYEAWIASEAGLSSAGARTSPVAPSRKVGMHGGDIGGEKFVVLALPPHSTMLEPSIVEGRWIADGENDTMVVNGALAAKSPEMRVGNRVTFSMGPGRVTMRIVGVTREAFSPATAYMPLAFFSARGHGNMTNAVRIALDRTDPASIERMKGTLEDALSRAYVATGALSSKSDMRFGFDQHMLMIYVALIIMSALVGGVGGLGLMTTMSLAVLERRREMGVLRAIGATPRAIALMLAVEGCVVAVMSWLIASLVAFPLSRYLGDLLVSSLFRTGLDFQFEWSGLVAWLVFSLLLGGAASVVPAWDASRKPIREALGYE